MANSKPDFLIPSGKLRAKRFKQFKEQGKHMIHRLRDWEPEDVVWGYETHGETASMGKTFSKDGPGPADADLSDSGFDAAQDGYEFHLEENLDTKGVAFLWVGRIESVHTESRVGDEGEPPLKEASFRSVRVLRTDYVTNAGLTFSWESSNLEYASGERTAAEMGACWFCDETSGSLKFDHEFDAFYHVDCAEEWDVAHALSPITEAEKHGRVSE